jgi:hypothetical protein
MTRSNPFMLIGAGAALATCALMLMSQVGVPSNPGSWGPPKKGVVNLLENFQSTTLPIVPPGGEYVVYTVPQDRWLTITLCGASARITVGSSTSNTLAWGESLGGNFSPKGYAAGINAGSDVGWVFRPGSQVVLKEVGGVLIPGQSYSNELFGFSLTGYSTRD